MLTRFQYGFTPSPVGLFRGLVLAALAGCASTSDPTPTGAREADGAAQASADAAPLAVESGAREAPEGQAPGEAAVPDNVSDAAAGADGSALFMDAEASTNALDATGSSALDSAALMGADAEAGTPPSADVLAILRKVATYQIAAGPGAAHPDWVNKWTEAVFYTGVMAAYQATSDAAYLQAATQWGQKNTWTLLGGTTTPPTRSADNQCAGQTYAEIYLGSPQATNATMIRNTQAVIDAMIANPAKGRVDWWWADALFMAPGVVARLGAATGQPKYFQFLDTMWADASSNLFDTATGLFWRDGTFLNTQTFWSRGNGWVMAGTARVLEYLPMNDPSRASYLTLLRTMASAIRPLQGADGLWRSDLLNPSRFANPETSGTGLFCFALAWGIRQGVLDRATYLPVATAAWHGLVAHVDAQGRLGYVQPTGSQPAAATAADSFDYGVGAFLLAASEMARL